MTPSRFWWRLPACLFLGMLGGLPAAGAQWTMLEDTVMGTRVRVELWRPDPEQGLHAATLAMEELRRIDRLMSPHIESSELAAINRNAASRPVPTGAELRTLIRQSLEYSRRTGGAFDITFASAGNLYDYRQGRRPAATELADVLPAVDFRHVQVDDAAGTVRFARRGVRIDLGGIAKGYAVDRALALLRGHGIDNALVSAGGDSRMLGDRRGKPWMIGVRDPRREGQVIAAFPIENQAVSTSGDYERFFEEGGQRFHHILNPGTGASARGVRSVTIIGPDAITTDALSTSVFVMGVGKGLALVNATAGVEAIVIDANGRISFSAGLERPLGEQVASP